MKKLGWVVLALVIVSGTGWCDGEEAAVAEPVGATEVARSEYHTGMEYLAQGDRWRACSHLAAAWQIGRMEDTRDPEAALLAAGPYCQLLFDFSLLDPLWWVAEAALPLEKEIGNPSAEVIGSVGWVHYWLLMQDRVLGELETAHAHADEAIRIAGEVNDATLRAWTRLERSRLYALAHDPTSAEVEILRCRAEPLYRADIDFRSQCELRMEEAHLAAGRYKQAENLVKKFLAEGELSSMYRTESLYLLGQAYRKADEPVRALWPLTLGSWLHPEHGSWRYHCMTGRDRLFEGRSNREGIQILELGRAMGPEEATAAVCFETVSRYGDEPEAEVARAWLDSATAGAVSPIVWQAILLQRLNRMTDPAQAESTCMELLKMSSGDYFRMDLILTRGCGKIRGTGGPDAAAAFLEKVRPEIPNCLYLWHRMEHLRQTGQKEKSVRVARQFIQAVPEPRLYVEYPWIRTLVPYQHAIAHFYVLQQIVDSGNYDALGPAINELFRDAPDPVIVQRTLAHLVEGSALGSDRKLAVRFLDQVLALEHSPVQKDRLLMRKAALLRDMSREREAQSVYREVMSGTAYLEGGGTYIGQAYLELARRRQREGRNQEAAGLYQTLIAQRDRIGQPAAEAFVELARLYRQTGRPADARDVVEVGLEWVDGTGFTHPHYHLRHLRGLVLDDLGDRAGAVEVFRDLAGEGWPDWVRRDAKQWLDEHGISG
jgi:tetratricopeptide (TPR) repeat protein